MALSAFTAQQGVSAGSSGHIADHNEIRSQIQEILDELTLYKTGRRNGIRNGDMGIAQRGGGPFTAGGYCLDGWIKGHTGGTHTVTQEGIGPGTYGGTGTRHVLRSVTAGQSAAPDYSNINQRIEGVDRFAGKEVTLSFVAQATSGTPKIGVEVIQNFGTGGAPSAEVQTAVQAVTISTTATRYIVTFTVPSISGKTRGNTENHYTQIAFWFSAGANFAARASSIGIQNTTIDITDVQLEQGSPTPFERLSQAEQLAWCQRYFYRLSFPVSGAGIATVSFWDGTSSYHFVNHPVRMRAVPTLGYAGTFTIFSNGGSTPITGLLMDSAANTPDIAEMRWTHAAVSNTANWIRTSAANAHIEFAAEL